MAKKKQIELTIEEKLQNALVPKEEQPYKIPNNWCWVRLDFLLKEICNGTTIKQNKEGKTARVTRIESLQNNTIDFNRIGNIVNESLIKDKDWYIEGDIIVSHINSIEHVGKSAVITRDMLPLVHGMNLLRLRLNNICNSQFFQLYTRTTDYKKSIVNRVNRAVNQVSINQKQLCSLEIPITNLKEQQRIVNRIESLFVKLDRAKELIENTLAQFEQNKMAILHKAFTGELTVKWRKEKGILKDTWKSMALENCGTWSGGGTPSMSCGDYWENGNIPWITSKDMKNIYIEKTQKYITEKGVECSSAKYIDKPAILFVTRSGILRRIFPVCMVKIPFTVNQDLKVLVPSKMVCLEYLYWICIYKSNKILGTCMKSGTTVESISTDKLKKFKITVPIIEEQQEIVNILDKLLAKYNKIKNLEQQLEKIELLKKAILAKAFRGELGTNNPDEESAENLLKEILAEK